MITLTKINGVIATAEDVTALLRDAKASVNKILRCYYNNGVMYFETV